MIKKLILVFIRVLYDLTRFFGKFFWQVSIFIFFYIISIMKLSAFYETYYGIFETIYDCLKQRRSIPALILIYAAIDGFSELSNKGDQTGKKVFKDWVKQWMLVKYPLPCNEIDLYAARCGLLHLQKSESDLAKKGEAKELWYCWGESEMPRLQFGINGIGLKVIAVKVEDIFSSFRNGMADCLEAIEKDRVWKDNFETKSTRLFKNIPNEL